MLICLHFGTAAGGKDVLALPARQQTHSQATAIIITLAG